MIILHIAHVCSVLTISVPESALEDLHDSPTPVVLYY